MKLFDLDSPIIRILTKMTDLLLLNLLTIVCSIPIVTAGAAFTALHYMTLKMARNEENYIIKNYFKSFKQNFKQATIIWILILLACVVLVGDFYILSFLEVSFVNVLRVVVMVVALIVMFTATFVFPILAKFDNSVWVTIKNAFIISVLQFPKTILMFILNWLPWILMFTVIQIMPLSIVFGFAAPAYASAFLYNKFFQKLEAQIEEANGGAAKQDKIPDDERIFHDELDKTIAMNENIH